MRHVLLLLLMLLATACWSSPPTDPALSGGAHLVAPPQADGVTVVLDAPQASQAAAVQASIPAQPLRGSFEDGASHLAALGSPSVHDRSFVAEGGRLGKLDDHPGSRHVSDASAAAMVPRRCAALAPTLHSIHPSVRGA